MRKHIYRPSWQPDHTGGCRQQDLSGRPVTSLQVHAADNVVVILEADGKIPAGHKIACRGIRAGDPIIKYGYPIGRATQDIAAGEWVHSHNLVTGLSGSWTTGSQVTTSTSAARVQENETDTQAFFAGYCRKDGQVGIRNEIWIIPTVGCINKTTELLAAYGQAEIQAGRWSGIDAVQALTHPFGCSQLGDDHEQTVRILAALTRQPNAAAVLVVSLGCENNQLASFQRAMEPYDTARTAFMVVQDVPDELGTGRELLRRLAAAAGQDRRTPCPLSDLVIGLKCGGSDAFSGLTANPLLGRLTDRVVRHGGSALLTETPEFFGAEQVILERTCEQEARTAFIRQMKDFRHYFETNGVPVYENPSPGNKAGGITTLEEKSLGCVQKAGTRPVSDVIAYGERLRRPGLTVVSGPGNDMIAITTLAAAGAQLLLFTTGRGNPLGGPVPTLKVASNSALAASKPHWIDFDAGPALQGAQARARLDSELLELVRQVASGTMTTCSERSGYREIAIFKNGVTL